MEMTFSVADIAGLVQAVCAMFGLIVAVVTLWILVGYARDTKTLAESSLLQIEASISPYLSIRIKQHPTKVSVVNHGQGPALDIVISGEYPQRTTVLRDGGFKHSDSVEGTDQIGDLGAGEKRNLEFWVSSCVESHRELTLTYRSLNGYRYQSTFHRSKITSCYGGSGVYPVASTSRDHEALTSMDIGFCHNNGKYFTSSLHR